MQSLHYIREDLGLSTSALQRIVSCYVLGYTRKRRHRKVTVTVNYLVRMRAVEGHEQAVEDELLANMRRVRAAAVGNVGFVVHRSRQDPREFWLYETWRDSDAAEQHAFERLEHPGIFELWSGNFDIGLALARGNARTDSLTFSSLCRGTAASRASSASNSGGEGISPSGRGS